MYGIRLNISPVCLCVVEKISIFVVVCLRVRVMCVRVMCVRACVCLCDGMMWGGLTVNFPFLGVNIERYIDVFERPSPHTLYTGTVGVKSEIISPPFHPLGEC